MLACRVVLPAGLAVGHAEGTCMQVLALLVLADAFVEANAESLVAMLLGEVTVFDLYCSVSAGRFALARDKGSARFNVLSLAFAFASFTLRCWDL